MKEFCSLFAKRHKLFTSGTAKAHIQFKDDDALDEKLLVVRFHSDTIDSSETNVDDQVQTQTENVQSHSFKYAFGRSDKILKKIQRDAVVVVFVVVAVDQTIDEKNRIGSTAFKSIGRQTIGTMTFGRRQHQKSNYEMRAEYTRSRVSHSIDRKTLHRN